MNITDKCNISQIRYFEMDGLRQIIQIYPN